MSDDYEDLKELTKKTAQNLFGDRMPEGVNAYEIWKSFDPELAKHLSMFYTGRMYGREVISQKQRELCAVAVLTVLNMPNELKAHCIAAMNVGAKKEEVAEVIFQTTTYHGVPTMLEGLKVLKEVIEDE